MQSAKTHLRQRLRETLAGLNAEHRDSASRRACQRVFQLPEYARADVVMAFVSLPSEIDTTPLVLRCWQDHKRVVVPKVSWEQRRMVPVEIQSLTEDLAPSEFGLREPVSGTPFPLSMVELVIVPGLGFDEYGNRLGRGRGFYDRFLSSADFRGTSCGLAFEEQVATDLPVGPNDKAVHLLVTDRKTRRFKAAAGAAVSERRVE